MGAPAVLLPRRVHAAWSAEDCRLIPPSDPVETLVDRFPTTMMPPMQKMAAPLALASALCHVATVAVMMNMHIQLSTVQDTATGPHRALLDSDGDSLVTVAHMTKAVDHLQDTLGSRLTAVERENNELKASMKALKDAQAGTEHGNHPRSDGNMLDEDMAPPLSDISHETVVANATKGDTTRIHAAPTLHRWANSTLHRRTQVAPQACARARLQALSAAAMDACCPRMEEGTGGCRPAAPAGDVPVGGVRGGVCAVYGQLRNDVGDAGRAGRGFPELRFLCGDAGGSRGDATASRRADVPRVYQHGGRGAGRCRDEGTIRLIHCSRCHLPSSTAGCGGRRDWGEQYHAEHLGGRRELRATLQRGAPWLELLATIDGTDTKFTNLAHGSP